MLQRILASALALCCSAFGQAQQPQANTSSAGKQTVLPAATPVRLRIAQTLSSKSAKAGEVVELEVMRDVRVDDLLVIPRHTPASGVLTQALSSRRLSRGGSMTIELKSVKTITGELVPIGLKKTIKGGPDDTQKDKDILDSGYLLFLPVILRKGEEAT